MLDLALRSMTRQPTAPLWRIPPLVQSANHIVDRELCLYLLG
jgi:hypothetical protein